MGRRYLSSLSVSEVPKTAKELWAAYDSTKEDLDVKVIKEWQEDGIIIRYLTYKVGTFKGTDARVAAYYSFPINLANTAFVWTHGGGQRAERTGQVLCLPRYAVIDINWLGRPMEEDIEENTDWGKVDPTQGPRFYKKALRKQWKRTLAPDEHSIRSGSQPQEFKLVSFGRSWKAGDHLFGTTSGSGCESDRICRIFHGRSDHSYECHRFKAKSGRSICWWHWVPSHRSDWNSPEQHTGTYPASRTL